MNARPGRAFAFRLCLALGFPHPDFLLRILTSRQVAEWEWFYGQEPWGFEIESTRAALIASTIGNFAGKQASRELSISDFMLRTREPRPSGNVAGDVLAVFGRFRRK